MSGMPSAPVQLGIVDDHPVFRLGLATALARDEGLEVRWQAGSLAETLYRLATDPVAVLLMDLHLGQGLDGPPAVALLTRDWPQVKVVILSALSGEHHRDSTLAAGAAAHLAKDLPVAEVVATIKALAIESQQPVRRLRRTPGRPIPLSERERAVLARIRLGETNQQIAAHLGITTNTVNAPYPDDASKNVRDWANRYKEKYKDDAAVFSVYGYVAIDLFAQIVAKAGQNLTVDSFVNAIESFSGPRDMFGSDAATFSKTKHLGSNRARLSQIVNGKWTAITDYITE